MRTAAACAVLLLACGGGGGASPDARSGADARWNKAQRLDLDPDTLEGELKGTVSFPKGDRTDWSSFLLDEGGDLSVTLKVKPGAPGLEVQMKLLDEHYKVLGTGVGAVGARKRVNVKGAPGGKYYVVVYAPDRQDKGSYVLAVKLKSSPGGEAQARKDVPLPERLPAVPAPDIDDDRDGDDDDRGNGDRDDRGSDGGSDGDGDGDRKRDDKRDDKRRATDAAASKLRVRIVSMRAGGAGTLLILDKGRSAGLKVGLRAAIIGKGGSRLAGEAILKTVGAGTATAETPVPLDELGDAAKLSFELEASDDR